MSSIAGIKKLYYSIGEVAAIVGEETHTLRFWEDEFEQLKPRRNRAGRRIYTAEDIVIVERIWHLLKVNKYTVEGARQVLQREKTPHESKELRRDLLRMRAFLENIIEQLSVQESDGT